VRTSAAIRSAATLGTSRAGRVGAELAVKVTKTPGELTVRSLTRDLDTDGRRITASFL